MASKRARGGARTCEAPLWLMTSGSFSWGGGAGAASGAGGSASLAAVGVGARRVRKERRGGERAAQWEALSAMRRGRGLACRELNSNQLTDLPTEVGTLSALTGLYVAERSGTRPEGLQWRARERGEARGLVRHCCG